MGAERDALAGRYLQLRVEAETLRRALWDMMLEVDYDRGGCHRESHIEDILPPEILDRVRRVLEQTAGWGEPGFGEPTLYFRDEPVYAPTMMAADKRAFCLKVDG